MKTALVTGSSSGIGLATVKALAERGYRVFAGVRSSADRDRLEALDGVTGVEFDVRYPEQVQAAVGKLPGDGLDLLVNNAGVANVGVVETVPLDTVRNVFEINLFGVWTVIQAALPKIRQAQGRIINVSSVSGFIAEPAVGAYCASKFALEALSDSLRMEMKPFGVEVIVVQPGQISTPIHNKIVEAFGEEEAAEEPEYRAVLEKVSEFVSTGAVSPTPPEEVAHMIADAALSDSPMARYRVGHDIPGFEEVAALPDRERDAAMLQLLGI